MLIDNVGFKKTLSGEHADNSTSLESGDGSTIDIRRGLQEDIALANIDIRRLRAKVQLTYCRWKGAERHAHFCFHQLMEAYDAYNATDRDLADLIAAGWPSEGEADGLGLDYELVRRNLDWSEERLAEFERQKQEMFHNDENMDATDDGLDEEATLLALMR